MDHIGVINQRQGYGTILMQEIFKIAKKLNRYPVLVVSNGYANDFYEKLGMDRINMKLPAIYEIGKEGLENFIPYAQLAKSRLC